MRVYIQMSVAGFKIFDINQFQHESKKGRYALMSEIASTQDGSNNAHTHIVRSDMHGMRLETMSLFSSRDVTMLLHDDFCEGIPARCFYANRYSLTTDKFNRECDVSLCLMSECDDDKKLINKFGYTLMYEKQSDVLAELQNVLRREPLVDETVLLFDTALWQTLCDRISQRAITPTTQMIDSIAKGDTQVVVLGKGQDKHGAVQNRQGLFNKDKYLVLLPSHLPLESHTLSVPAQTEWMLSSITQTNDELSSDNTDTFHEILKDVKDIFSQIINRKL